MSAGVGAIILIALLWSLLQGQLSVGNLVFGALLGTLVLAIMQRDHADSFMRRLLGFARFVVSFFVELLVANVTIAWLAIKARPEYHPHVIAVPLRLTSDNAITLLAATITLLPGTVAMGVSEDKRLLYAHAIGEADPERSRQSVSRIEELILGFMR